MSSKKQKLELTWIGKENRPKLEPRILVEDTEKFYHAKHWMKEWPRESAKNTKDFDTLRSLRPFAASEIDNNRERMIAKIEGKLNSNSADEALFTIRWSLN